jgi:cytochrome P450
MAEQDRQARFETADFYMDPSLVEDPYPYLEYLRGKGPVTALPHHNVIAVTGFEEALEVYHDVENFSAVNCITGPIPPIPFEPDREDITDLIEAHRPQMLFGEEFLTLDPPRHTAPRLLMMRLFTPRRLADMEGHLGRVANQLLDEIEPQGACEFNAAYAKPFASLAVADLLGVPEEDRAEFRAHADPTSTHVGERAAEPTNPMEFGVEKFTRYLTERRRAPRGDIMSDLATAKHADGSTPDLAEVASVANLMFAAGQDTAAALIASAVRIIAEQSGLQERLRTHPDRIAPFVEEVLRTCGPVKSTHRLARRATSIGGVDVPVGAVVMVSTAAINRDPAVFEHPGDFDPDRILPKQHLAFGRGIHTCPGAGLARAEARISLEHILSRFSHIEIDETHHGADAARRYPYQPTYVFRALEALHVRFKSSPS